MDQESTNGLATSGKELEYIPQKNISLMKSIGIQRDPESILAEAQKAAMALKRVIELKPKKVIFNGEQYLEFEDWSTVSNFYKAMPRVVSSTYIELGQTRGFECRAQVIHMDTGIVLSEADSMCMNDEENWSMRNGRPVPMFQLRSMAQTRAMAKALRNVFAWVVVLAGFKATPAEEMEGVFGEEKRRVNQPESRSGPRSDAPPHPGEDNHEPPPPQQNQNRGTSRPISEGQVKLLYARAKANGVSNKDLETHVFTFYGKENLSLLNGVDTNIILKWIEDPTEREPGQDG